ncbi:hypothetical protein MauCBS54593_004420 [Microsporum audouinii]
MASAPLTITPPATQADDADGHIVSPAGVTEAMRRELFDIIRPIKLNLCPTADVTNDDVTRFLDRVFDGWITKISHSKPGKTWAQAAFEDTAVEVRTLARDLPTSATTKAGRNKADWANAYNRELPGSQTDIARKRGAPMFIRAIMNDGLDSVTFQFLDKKSKIVSGKQGTYFSNMDKAEIYFFAMQRHNSYYAGRVHEYNQAIGVFLARGRLQFWREGNPVHTKPVEQRDLIIRFELCRNIGEHR